jgi:putative transposase
LAVIDEYTRECLAIEVDRSCPAQDVIGILQYLFTVRGTPQFLRSDNSPEFVAQTVRCCWLDRVGVATLFIARRSPWEKN